ncbi:hypothetical protein GEMRC1_013138 [Eukaryota sp. GEM-RC1]
MQFELYYGEGFVRRMCVIDGSSRDCTTLSGFEEIPSNSAVFNIPKLCRLPDLSEFNSFSLDFLDFGHVYFNLTSKLFSHIYDSEHQIFYQNSSTYSYDEINNHCALLFCDSLSWEEKMEHRVSSHVIWKVLLSLTGSSMKSTFMV